jgi:hypothetical protein
MSESNPFLSETYESDRNIIKHSIEQPFGLFLHYQTPRPLISPEA